jgi:glycosyltransferase involved in cell wall biosynthesis
MEISVIICAHNPRPNYLRRVLDSLKNQMLPKERWELILVDNASRTPLAPDWDLSWHSNARHVVESKLGLTLARQCGMREAKADLLVFVDDDNVLDPNFLSVALKIKDDWPILGAWGTGRIIPEFEVPPAKNLKLLLWTLALREVKSAGWGNVCPNGELTPWGAGLCVRAKVAKEYCNYNEQTNFKMTGRQGNILLGGEDIELSFVACKLGYGVGIFPELKLIHLIPKERVSPDYLIRISETYEFSQLMLAYKWKGELPKSPFSIRGLLYIIINAVIPRGIKRRWFFARLRGTIAARRIIAAHQTNDNATSGAQ